MLQQAFTRYINNFRGFSREVWILAIITFINRAGTMVFPFLSKYLKEDLHFSYNQVGWVMVCFGTGSMLGSWIGGKLSDKIGFYKVMVFSMLASGSSFFIIQYITTFTGLCIAMFSIMVIADMFRPAMFVSLGTYAKPENRTRAFTLVRLAINFGFMAGPAMGGLIILGIGYKGLFWADGASCIISILIFMLLVKEKKRIKPELLPIEDIRNTRTIANDRLYWVFLFCSFITATVFFQLFSTLPLYHREQYGLSEFHTGLLMSFNGLLVLLCEMPIVGYVERKGIQKIKVVALGAFFMGLSFFALLFEGWVGTLVISMIIISYAEMFNFPFSNGFAMNRAPRGREGQYMAYYTMMFSLAHIVSGKTGLSIIEYYKPNGYIANWIFMGSLALLATFSLLLLQKKLLKENT